MGGGLFGSVYTTNIGNKWDLWYAYCHLEDYSIFKG